MVKLVCCLLQVETEGLRRSIQNLGVLLTTAAVAHTSVATGEGLRHAATGQHHTITVTSKDKVPSLIPSPSITNIYLLVLSSCLCPFMLITQPIMIIIVMCSEKVPP